MTWVERLDCPIPTCKAYEADGCLVFVGIEPAGWHLSISRRDRYPSWEEIKEARYAFIPDEVTVAMILPPKAEWVNIHNNCFHLHQIPGEREAAKGARRR